MACVLWLWTAVIAESSFWQLTDIHVDLEQECTNVTGDTKYGNFDSGHFGCGATTSSVADTLSFMKSQTSAPDFIIFTGDAPWSGTVLDTMASIESSISGVFPDTPHYFLLGNHDFVGSPVGPDATNWYPKVAKLWGKWLDPAAAAEFAA
jgi:hypothetical protein